MTLVLTLVVSAVALTALFWGLALVLQGYLYSQPADRLPLRAAVGGLAVACMLTGWAYVNTRADHKDKYGTLFEFTPTSTREVTEFEAVRQSAFKDASGKPKETTTKYKWTGEGKAGRFVDADGKEFRVNDPASMTVAIVVPEGDQKTRFDAVLKDGRYVGGATEERRFEEQGGNRSIDGQNPRLMVVPSPGALAAAVGLNVLHFVVWFLVFWPVLRFNLGHALGLTAIFGSVSMLVVMPLLFNLNAVKARTEASPTAAVERSAAPPG